MHGMCNHLTECHFRSRLFNRSWRTRASVLAVTDRPEAVPVRSVQCRRVWSARDGVHVEHIEAAWLGQVSLLVTMTSERKRGCSNDDRLSMHSAPAQYGYSSMQEFDSSKNGG